MRRDPTANASADTYRPRKPAIGLTLREAIAFATRKPPSRDEIAALAATLPYGDGGAVLVLPTVFRNDVQTAALRDLLGLIRYVPFGWNQGVNLGPTPALMAGAARRLADIATHHGPVALIGFSMGGLFARWLALRSPALVRQVITAGSPFREAPDSTFLPLGPLLGALPGANLRSLAAEIAQPMPVPTTCIYNPQDGIVAWESCRDPERPDDNIEVESPHTVMPHDIEVFRVIADRLAVGTG